MTATDCNRVLVVDDVAENLELYERALAERLEVVACDTGEAGLGCILGGTFAVVVSDHRLPGISGIELLTRVAAAAPDTVRILVTGYADLATAMAAVNRARCAAVLTKPVDVAELAAEVERGVEQYNGLQRLRGAAAHAESLRPGRRRP